MIDCDRGCSTTCYVTTRKAVVLTGGSGCVCRMLAEYIAASPGTSVAEAVQLLSGPPLVRLVHTKEGAQVACAVISYGTAKDRKKAIKGLAGQAESILKMAQDEFGHAVLLCILDTVDDTALLKKQILPEIQVILQAADGTHKLLCTHPCCLC